MLFYRTFEQMRLMFKSNAINAIAIKVLALRNSLIINSRCNRKQGIAPPIAPPQLPDALILILLFITFLFIKEERVYINREKESKKVNRNKTIGRKNRFNRIPTLKAAPILSFFNAIEIGFSAIPIALN